MDKFVNLHNHSEYSLLDGFGRISEYVDRAVELGQPALGLTDHGNLYGIHNFILECQKKGIKPIPGIEAYMAPQNPFGSRCHTPIRYGKKGQESIDVSGSGAYLHLTLFAMNTTGLHNLYKLVMEASKEGNEYNHLDMEHGEGNFYMKPRMDIDMLALYHEGIIATTGCPSGEIQTRFRLGQDQEAYDYARRMSEMFKGRYYVEIMNHDMKKDIERSTIDKLLKLSQDLSLPLIATNDSHYCKHEDAYHHSELLCANSKSLMTDPTYDNGGSRFAFEGDQYFLKSRKEMEEVLPEEVFQEALDNTVKLADSVEEFKFDMHKDLRPIIEIPDGYTEEQWFREKIKEGYQRKRVDAGCSKDVLEESKRRINKEISVFIDNDFVQYMLVVQDYISWARNHGIGVGYGRGSVGGSEVAYVMDISDTDPIKNDLLFERFLNPERISPPDVDTDFAASRRDEVADYVKEKYGEDHITNIVTFGRFMSKNAIKDMARIYGIAPFESDKAAKLIPGGKKPISLKEIYDPSSPKYKEGTDFREMMNQRQWKKAILAARAMEGRVKTTGVHACGIIMSSKPIVDYAPMIYKHNPTKPWGSSISQWTYQELESMGLIKMDFLSLSDIDIVAETLKNIRHTHDEVPDMEKIVHGDMDDPETYKMLSNGSTVGIFQLSSTGMQSLFQRMNPTKFDDIMASVALYRPGPMDMDAHIAYAERKSGKAKDVVINADMDSSFKGTPVDTILQPTHGLCVYQEQVMNISRLLSGFSWKEADILRKGMGHKIMKILNEMGPKFIEGAINKSHIDKQHAERLWDYLRAFGEYGFNKSHSASYGMISYETAWLKCHYPAEFMAAVITDKFRNAKDASEKMNMIKEAREMGLVVSSIDINNSGIGMSAVRKKNDDDPDIVFGFSGVKGLSNSVANDIIEAREDNGGEFLSVDNFMRNIPSSLVSKRILDGIGGAGGFDRFGVSRRAIVAVAEDMASYYKMESKSKDQGKRSLFDDFDDDDNDAYNEAYRMPDIREWDWITKLDQEEERLGAVISGHPTSRIGEGLEFLKIGYMYKPDRFGQVMSVMDSYNVNIRSSKGTNGKTWYDSVPVRIIASVDSCINKTTRRGDKIITGMIEDMQSSLQYRVSSEDLDKILSESQLPMHNHVYVIKGELTYDWNDNLMLKAFKFDEVELSDDGMMPIWFRMASNSITSKGYEKLMELLSRKENKGDIPVLINTKNPENMRTSEVDTGCRVKYSKDLEESCEQLLGIKRFGRWDR